ncbi:MAG: selenide, water dikinase SelD [Planctomycetota bacterium]|nr:selenide, water dikinase SelD [Planctomycetota bacterium]RLS36691.1 MAG: selenide, water dikinase SelD [Planctomycetota bacterium]
MPPGSISQVLRFVPPATDPNLLVGTRTHDDAGVYRLSDDLVLVQTVDFFPPVIDDAYIYGQIAAANALSDVYAMNGEPKTAMNLVGYPDDTDPALTWLGDILGGGGERCALAGAAIVGGHTVRDREIKFGLSVTGIAHPRDILTNATAQPGDKLVLTKPLGTGFVTTAHRARRCPDSLLANACASMVELNRSGRDALRASGGATALTDITGFGLAGHGLEMAQGSGVQAVIRLGALPLIAGVEPFIERRFFTRASKTNRAYVEPHLQLGAGLDLRRLEVFFDAQTSGGLLISVSAQRAPALIAELVSRKAVAAAIIGEIRPWVPGQPHLVVTA